MNLEMAFINRRTILLLPVVFLFDGPLRAADKSAKDLAKAKHSIPAYHHHPPRGRLPNTIDPKEFTNPIVQRSYAMASRIKPILYQLPCYCRCDLYNGHKSLLDCYVTKHASGCDECQKEGRYAYNQATAGMTVSEIRGGIIAGAWKHVTLD